MSLMFWGDAEPLHVLDPGLENADFIHFSPGSDTAVGQIQNFTTLQIDSWQSVLGLSISSLGTEPDETLSKLSFFFLLFAGCLSC